MERKRFLILSSPLPAPPSRTQRQPQPLPAAPPRRIHPRAGRRGPTPGGRLPGRRGPRSPVNESERERRLRTKVRAARPVDAVCSVSPHTRHHARTWAVPVSEAYRMRRRGGTSDMVSCGARERRAPPPVFSMHLCESVIRSSQLRRTSPHHFPVSEGTRAPPGLGRVRRTGGQAHAEHAHTHPSPAMSIPSPLLPALETLFGAAGHPASSTPDARRAAEAWLVAFQEEEGAWAVSPGGVDCTIGARERGSAGRSFHPSARVFFFLILSQPPSLSPSIEGLPRPPL